MLSYNRLRILSAVSAVAISAGVFAAPAEDIRALLDAGKYREARAEALVAIEDAANAKSLGELNQLAGEAAFKMRGTDAKAKQNFEEAKKRGVADASLYLARIAMNEYDFPTARKLYAEYKKLKTRAKKPLEDDFEVEERSAEEALTLFDRVKDVVVIDAIEVPRRDFFKKMRLPASAGRILEISKLGLNESENERGEVGYQTESGSLLMWSEMNDSTGYMTIAEASRLGDGRLTETILAPDFLSEDGDALFPFLSADGTTLYYASDGMNTIGGLDIFMATRDPSTGEYLQPVNAGMPFNSPADDYMLAIDEENGVGWWATDRNRLPGDKITLYVYLLDDERKNVDGSAEMRRERATLKDIRKTWEPRSVTLARLGERDDDEDDDDDEDSGSEASSQIPTDEELQNIYKEYEATAEMIRAIKPGQKTRKPGDYHIKLLDGGSIYSADEVKDPAMRAMVEKIFAQHKQYEQSSAELGKLRREYAASASPALGRKIEKAEAALEQEKEALTRSLSQFYRFLGRK